MFALAQVVQVGALLAAPLMIRRFGLLNAIVVMMAATACGLGALGTQPARRRRRGRIYRVYVFSVDERARFEHAAHEPGRRTASAAALRR